MENIFRALAEPKRVAILRLLRDRERAVGEIAGHFDVTRPAISQHLRVLADAGLVIARQEGTQRLYSIRSEGIEELRHFVEEFWDIRLERLKDAVEQSETGAE